MNSVYKDKLPSFLSVSRAKDYLQCPMLFYFKTVLGLTTPLTKPLLKGTIAHHVFEHVFDHAPEQRTEKLAQSYIPIVWNVLTNPLSERFSEDENPLEYSIRYKLNYFRDLHSFGSESERKIINDSFNILSLFSHDIEQINLFLEEVKLLVSNWFTIENPSKFTPLYREKYLSASIGNTPIHGYIDRVDLFSNDLSDKYYISDYKTGKIPSLRYQDDAFFQLGVYALLLEKYTGVKVHEIRLIYVSSTGKESVLSKKISDDFLRSTFNKIENIWNSILNDAKNDSFTPKPQVLCDWCSFKDVCPAFNKDLFSVLPEELEFRSNFN